MSSFKIFVYPCNVTGCRWIDDPWLTCWVFSWVASLVISKFDKGDLVHSRMDSFVTTVRFDVTLFVTVIACPCIFFWLYYLLSLLLVIVRPDIPPRRPYSEASRLFIFSRYLPRPPLLDWIRFVVAPAALVAACSLFCRSFSYSLIRWTTTARMSWSSWCYSLLALRPLRDPLIVRQLVHIDTLIDSTSDLYFVFTPFTTVLILSDSLGASFISVNANRVAVHLAI